MAVPQAKKHEYWNHFVAGFFVNEQARPGITAALLRSVKYAVFGDEEFWDYLITKHGGLTTTPEEMRLLTPELYKHYANSFWRRIISASKEGEK